MEGIEQRLCLTQAFINITMLHFWRVVNQNILNAASETIKILPTYDKFIVNGYLNGVNIQNKEDLANFLKKEMTPLHKIEIKKEIQEMFNTLTEESKTRSSYLILTQHFDKISITMLHFWRVVNHKLEKK